MKLAAAAALAATGLIVGGDMRQAKPPATLVTQDPLPLRVAPDGGAPVRTTLASGAAFTIAIRQGNWVLVRSGEQWGWVVEPELPPAR